MGLNCLIVNTILCPIINNYYKYNCFNKVYFYTDILYKNEKRSICIDFDKNIFEFCLMSDGEYCSLNEWLGENYSDIYKDKDFIKTIIEDEKLKNLKFI